MKFKPIPTDEDELIEIADIPFLVTAKKWEHADVALFDPETLEWYSPIDGSSMVPEPTHYMEIPKL